MENCCCFKYFSPFLNIRENKKKYYLDVVVDKYCYFKTELKHLNMLCDYAISDIICRNTLDFQ